VTEAERLRRNAKQLADCHPNFAAIVADVLSDMETEFPLTFLADAWRDPVEQLRKKAAGLSKLSWGFHNATSPTGRKESLAIHFFDGAEAKPADPSVEFLMRLAHHALRRKLSTGIVFGLTGRMRLALLEAIDRGDRDWPRGKLGLGWDSCHVETTAVSVAQAKRGLRP
jgi:hypothetical protein